MPKKNPETRNRGLFLDPVKVDEEMRRLNITDRQQLAKDAGRSLTSIDKIWKRLKMDEDTAHAIAGVLGRTVDYLELKDVPTTTDPTPQRSQHPFLEQIKAINDALSYLYATLQKATHVSRDFRAEALASVHGMGQKVVFLNPIPDESINGREGSLIITFPISRHDARTLMNAFIAGDLEEFEIVSVSLSSIPHIAPEVPAGDSEESLDLTQGDTELVVTPTHISRRDQHSSLWDKAPFKYSVGDIVPVRMFNVSSSGATVVLEVGVFGFMHIPILSPFSNREPAVPFQGGQVVRATILAIDTNGRQITLSLHSQVVLTEPNISSPEQHQRIE